ncbi:MAG TPA: amidohydrolase family protein [Pyrinomonadaceae bacterium]|jgi:5-methylthioadenosine/S-adenosylhomocysteine deaminase
MKIISADYVLPISGIPLENGALVIENEKIVAVGTQAEIVAKFPEAAAAAEDFGEAVIMPGFVNAHSHLEISAMRSFLDDVEHDFSKWLLKLSTVRAEKLTEPDIEISAVWGALEGLRAGVTCFGDIGRYGKAGFEALKKTGLRGIAFQETDFSPKNETAADDFARLEEKFLALKETETSLVKAGISPHSPYTVSRRLFEIIADYALRREVELSIHAAESKEETEFMQHGTGFFAGIYRKFGHEWETPGVSSIEYFNQIGILQTAPLLAHCVTVSEKDIETIGASGTRIAHCPKSNAKFGHGIAPFEKFLDRRIKVGLGSDSVASNNTCDILEESRFAALLARAREDKKRLLNAAEILEAATLGGAKALNLEREIGTLDAGKQADLIVISLNAVAQQPVHDAHSAILFASTARDIRLTMIAGREIYRNGAAQTVDEDELRFEMKRIARKMIS